MTCLAGAGTRGTRRWVVVRRQAPDGRVTVLRRRPRPVGAAGRDAAEGVRIHLLTPTGALVPVVLADDVLADDVLTDDLLTDGVVGVRPARAECAPDADPGCR